MFKKIVSSAIIVLCLLFIGCSETEMKIIKPIVGETIIVNSDNTGLEVLALTQNYIILNLISESDLIFVGKVCKRESLSYTVHLEIAEILKGETEEEIATFTGRIYLNFLEGDRYVIFLRKGGRGFFLTTLPYDFLSIIETEILSSRDDYQGVLVYDNALEDIKLMVSSYNENEELFFSKDNLFNLYPQLKCHYIQCCFLRDIFYIQNKSGYFRPFLYKEDIPTLLEWQEKETPFTTIYNLISNIIMIIRE